MTFLLDFPVLARSASPARAGSAGWADVADELARSCAARAVAGALLHRPGVVGVLAGAAPVVWVHGAVDAPGLVRTLAASPEVVEVHVRADDLATTRAREAAGWRTQSVTAQLVHPGRAALGAAGHSAPPVEPAGCTVRALTATDLPEVRALLAEAAGAVDGPTFEDRPARKGRTDSKSRGWQRVTAPELVSPEG